MTARLRAGTARCDITPPVGISHGNWSAQVHEGAEGIDIPLSCTVLSVTDGNEEVLIVEWDLLFPPTGAWLQEMQARITALTGVPASHIRISASHTHSGPNLSKAWFDGGADMIAPYVASLTDRVAGTCVAAQRAQRPARIGSGTGSCKVNSSRRLLREGDRPLMYPNPNGFCDHSVGVIRIDDDETDQPIAILVNYAAHPTILAWDNRLISTDYPGTVRRTVEQISGGTCLFLQGATGDLDTIRDFSCRPEDARWIGRQIGLEAVRVAELISTRRTEPRMSKTVESSWTMGVVEYVPVEGPEPVVRCITRDVALPIWHRGPATPEEIAEYENACQRLADLHAAGAPADQIREANRLAKCAGMSLNIIGMRNSGTERVMPFQAIRIGDVALVGIPVEPFSAIGVAVKEASPFTTTFFSGYTNGANAYLPTAEAYDEGGYEVWITPYAPEAAQVAIDESIKLLKDLA